MFIENPTIKRFIGSYIFSNEDKIYQFYLVESNKDELILIYTSNKAKIEFSILEDEIRQWPLEKFNFNKQFVVQITTEARATNILFTLINLTTINEKTKISKDSIEKLFNCEIVS